MAPFVIPSEAQPNPVTDGSLLDITSVKGQMLLEYLEQVKAQHTPGGSVTDTESAGFLKLVFASKWTSKEFSLEPDKKMMNAGLQGYALPLGTLVRDLPVAGQSSPHKARNRADKHKIHKKPDTPSLQQQDPNRRAGAKIIVRVAVSEQRGAIFQFTDINGRIVPAGGDYIVWNDDLALANVRWLAVQAYEHFQFKMVHWYNMQLALHYARSRLTWWANGNPVATRPAGEDFTNFTPLNSLRDLPGVDEGSSWYRTLKDQPRRGLFDFF